MYNIILGYKIGNFTQTNDTYICKQLENTTYLYNFVRILCGKPMP